MNRVPSLPRYFHFRYRTGYKLILCLVLCMAFGAGAVAAPVVTASIRPLQLIAAAITDGVATPGLIFEQEQDPHHAALRPSSRQLLADAGILLWVGPALELPLVNILAEHPGTLLTAQELDGIVLHDDTGSVDPHVWLDTRNARTIADALSETLIRLDPDNAARYRANRDRFAMALDTLDAGIEQALAASASRDWAVYHQAFRYFERQFALQPPMTLADDANNPPGMRSILALRKGVQQNALACLLIEPGVSEDTIASLLGTDTLPVITADVMGIGFEPTPDAFIQMMRGLAEAVSNCLQEPR